MTTPIQLNSCATSIAITLLYKIPMYTFSYFCSTTIIIWLLLLFQMLPFRKSISKPNLFCSGDQIYDGVGRVHCQTRWYSRRGRGAHPRQHPLFRIPFRKRRVHHTLPHNLYPNQPLCIFNAMVVILPLPKGQRLCVMLQLLLSQRPGPKRVGFCFTLPSWRGPCCMGPTEGTAVSETLRLPGPRLPGPPHCFSSSCKQ